MSSNPSELFSPFLPATFTVPEEDERLQVFLVDKFSEFADVINDKKIGTYTQTVESLNGDKWLYDATNVTRNGYQTIARISSYPNASTLTLTTTSTPQYPLKNVNPQFVTTLAYGVANKPCTAIGAGDGDYFSFMAKGDSRISFTMSDTQIIITTTTDLRSYSGFIVIHYLRNGI